MKKNIADYFEKQLNSIDLVVNNDVYEFKSTYFDGDPIETGDKLLMAWLVKDNDDTSRSLILLNERHFDLFEVIPSLSNNTFFPTIK